MVAIVAGNSLGLARSSAAVLGSNGTLGNASIGLLGSGVTVNAATGNLVIQNQDQVLVGRGLDLTLSRSYNSLGLLNDDNGDNWRESSQRSITALTGTVNTAGSTVTRTDWDGSSAVYSWDGSEAAYVLLDGTGAADQITYSSNVWTWTGGDSHIVETYDNLNGGRITSSTDIDGNQLTFTYTGANLTRVTTANGDYMELIESRVRYSYDTNNRLQAVTIDLSPEDNSISDGKTVSYSYGYDGSSNRITSISETGTDNVVQWCCQSNVAGLMRAC
jgi:YD repeat-containing protein